MNYERMTRVALYVAQGGMEDWPKSSVEDMAEQCGAEASYDFYQALQRRYGVDCSQQLDWLDEIYMQEQEE